MIHDLIIRREEPKDYEDIRALLIAAFGSGHSRESTEYLLVEQLRRSPDFNDEIALVAELGDQVVGYVLLTEVLIKEKSKSVGTLALAPIAVLPDYQRRGIGSNLMLKAHARAKELGYLSIVLIGHEKYYPRFGYQRASKFNISFPFEVPDQNAMVLELQSNALKNVAGKVIYPQAFLSI